MVRLPLRGQRWLGGARWTTHLLSFPFNLAHSKAGQSTNSAHRTSAKVRPADGCAAYNLQLHFSQWRPPMSRLDDLAERIERLALRHEELRRTNGLLEQQLASVTQERDSLKSRLNAARARIDALLERLPADPPVAHPSTAAQPVQGGEDVAADSGQAALR